MNPTTWLERIDRLPPLACRLCARRHRKPLTNEQIATAAGMTIERVAFISKQKSFGKFPIEEIDRFRMACGITPANEWRHVEYLKRTFDPWKTNKPLRHLDQLPAQHKTRLLKLIVKYE